MEDPVQAQVDAYNARDIDGGFRWSKQHRVR